MESRRLKSHLLAHRFGPASVHDRLMSGTERADRRDWDGGYGLSFRLCV